MSGLRVLEWRGEFVQVAHNFEGRWSINRGDETLAGPETLFGERWPDTAQRIRAWLDMHFDDRL